MSIHHLKINKQPFDDLVSGRKTGEVRDCSDRDFKVGDSVELFMTETATGLATESIVRTITHIQRGYGLPDDICVLSYATPAADHYEDALHMVGPVVERQPFNQCDGCRAGRPLVHGNLHVMIDANGYQDFMACTAHLYAVPPELAELQAAKRDAHNSEVAYKAAIEKQDELRATIAQQAAEIERIKKISDNYCALGMDANQEIFRLRAQLADAAQSLETISLQAGRDEFMKDMTQIRGYANSRARVAQGALSASAEPSKAGPIPAEMAELALKLSKGPSPEEVRRNQAIAMGIKIERTNKESAQ